MQRNIPRRTVLLVEDNDDLRTSVARQLEEEGGLDVRQAENGEVALRVLLACEQIRVIISDLDMPVMDGAVMLQEVRGNPTLQHIPFVLLTGREKSDVRKMLRERGIPAPNNIFAKPIENFRGFVREILNLASDPNEDAVS